MQKNFDDYTKKYKKGKELFKFNDKVKISNQCLREAKIDIKKYYP